jgi:multimeric flavodoxin WrbA
MGSKRRTILGAKSLERLLSIILYIVLRGVIMKILAIMGSTKNGNTTEIVKYFEKRLCEYEKFDFEYLYLYDYNIDFCTGCHNCILIGQDKCPHHQNVKLIEDKMLESDAIILASPGYMFSVTGIMKNFLDHVAYNCHRPKYFGKKAFLISSCTKWQEKSVFIPMKTWASASGFKFVGKTFVDMLPLPFNEKEKNKRRKTIDEAASKLYSEFKKFTQIKPNIGEVIVFHVFRTLCKIAPNILKADYEYFKQINAYDKNSKWYVPAKISNFKHKFADFMEKRIEKEISKMIDFDKLNTQNVSFRNKL